MLEKQSTSQNRNSRKAERSISPVDTCCVEDNRFNVPATIESDDEVFTKKESPRSGRLSSDSGLQDSSSSTASTPGSQNPVNADVIKRCQSEFYRHVLTNTPYLLNPETMAAAVAMTSLTSPLGSPTNSTQFPVISMEQSPMLLVS